ncbi:hypothetical protein [Vibrio coralliilyticus]|uniref:hypothetical protein n=1 Tax=Vibrio coralliilyticus TaxID=190893 RepID=UPI00148E1525|nr:hypothetical protein [Vibrio coralliilyticus]NOI28120.1 hypothetical protein [Vibrio coralliilyticus]NOI49419.1 hypothetical protein [Vibrio coralliilyticus]
MAANTNVTGLTTEELSKAIADATVAATTAVAKATTTANASLKLKTDDALANANGFKADRVVTEGYLQANYAKAHDYLFCLREISFEEDDNDLSAFSVQELTSILDPNGCDLAMMPLIHFAKESKTGDTEPLPISVDASKVVDRLKGLGLPIDVTIWFDSKNLNDCVSNKDFITELTDAGYSVGYFGGSACACPQGNGNMQNGSIVLDNVQCGSKTEAGGGIQTFTIGDNSGACKIRWIKPQ